MVDKPKICIISDFGYTAISGKGEALSGGELQMNLLSRELVNRSYNVSFVTFETRGDPYEVIGGVKVYNLFNTRYGGYTYVFPQNIYKIGKLFKKINADIYIKKGWSTSTGIVALIVKLMNKSFLFVASHEWDVSTNLDIFPDLSNILYRFGVKYSSKVICQTKRQKNLLKQKINKDSVVIKNIYPLPKIQDIEKDPSKLKILWVARLKNWKRPEIFVQLARELPECKFCMILSADKIYNEYLKNIKKLSEGLNNLEIINYVSHDKINEYYQKSAMLVSTSKCEGFPNTFLEAWGNSIPVVSLNFDPDEIICKKGIGIHVENFDKLVVATSKLIKDNKMRVKMGIEGRKYVEKEHNIKNNVDQYEKIFNEIK
jgi:glycosyltransferase involved in cell wall biosynthesis